METGNECYLVIYIPYVPSSLVLGAKYINTNKIRYIKRETFFFFGIRIETALNYD